METPKALEDWGEVVDASQFGGPVVFHFRPERFVKVAPNRLKEWEQYFMDNVGMLPNREQAKRFKRGRGSLSETMSGSFRGWDDCDYV